MSKKYFIVPVNNIAMEIYAESAESALEGFAWGMDSDMNTYFKAVTEEEYNNINNIEEEKERDDDTIKNFIRNIIIDIFDVPEEDADEVVDWAYNHYVKRVKENHSSTEYESAEWAAEKYWEEDN